MAFVPTDSSSFSQPVVSVVIPAFNAADFIWQAIDSVLRQSFSDLEVIVVDDGSSDETAARVSQINDPRVHLIRQDNQGQSAAINTGVMHSRGAYIKLLDADDWLNPAHIESQWKAIDGRPNVLASCRWGYFVNDFTKPAVRNEHTNKDYDSPLEWLVDSLTRDEGMMGGWMWLIPRGLWDKAGGFDPRLSLNNDFHFSIKLLLASEGVRFARDAVYSYRKGMAGALSGSSGRHAMESAFLTTELGTELMLQHENSLRIRKLCADRFQQWLFRFYPDYPDLVAKAEQRIEALGGSGLELQGGLALKVLKPFIGWKAVRQIQQVARKTLWRSVLDHKTKTKIERFKRQESDS